MKYIINLDELSKKDVKIAGGKGASLGELIQGHFDVPTGFVVTTLAFDQFLIEERLETEIESALDKVNHEDIHSIAVASEKIRTMILSAEFPSDLGKLILADFRSLNIQHVAVRSSATAEDGADTSWAGELESYLNTTEKTLFENVKRCWASLFTPRAIYYRFENDLHKKKVSVAVIIQAMIQSEVSGICFTTHPVTEDPNQLLIEAGIGLGEAIVGGLITPDNYVIDKKYLSLEEASISQQKSQIAGGREGTKEIKISADEQSKQKLSGAQIIELAKICIKIEKHFDAPCDIEWAYADHKFYITQSRPITTLQKL